MFEQELCKTSLVSLLAHEPNEPARCVTGLFPFPRLPCVCYCRHDAHWSNCCGKALPNWNVPYGSLSCCCGIFVIELVVLYFHYLSICNFQIYCSEETHLAIHVVRWKLSGFFWFLVCLWEVPELSHAGVSGVGGRAKFTHLVSSCWYIHKFLSPNTGKFFFWVLFSVSSWVWMLSYLAFHFFETVYTAFQHICNGKVHLYKIFYSCYNI